MKRIITAIDGSEESKRALEMAARLASAYGAKLTIAHVVPLYDEELDLGTYAEFEQATEDYANKLLEDAAQAVDLPPVQVDRQILRGTPAEAVTHAAQASDVGMVVVGSRGRGAVARMLLGSVSDRLVHVCQKPVLIVR